MIISGYKHDNKRNIMYVSKTKTGKRELISSSQYVNYISDFAFLPVNCFQSFSCAKKRHESNKSVEIVHYMNCNFSRRITETLTMLVPMLGLDYYFTVHRYDIVRLLLFFFIFFFLFFFIFIFFVVQDHVVTKIRYTSFMPALENDHSNFYIYSLNLPTGTLAVIKRGIYKS